MLKIFVFIVNRQVASLWQSFLHPIPPVKQAGGIWNKGFDGMSIFELLNPRLKKLVEQRFKEPTDVQEKVFQKILDGEDILAIAPTGIGKTEACMLPLFSRLLEKKHKPIAILYITPMRSLNRNMMDRLYWWCDKLELEISVRHGDTTQAERAMQRETPPHLLVTTPETLGAILPGKIMREHLKNVRYVIVDEIHEFVESKRGSQLSIILERLEMLSGQFQRIGLSATVGSPDKVAAFLSKRAKTVKAEGRKQYDIRVELPLPSLQDKQMAEELFVGEHTTARMHRIRELINQNQSVLTFTNTRETAEVISSRFRAIDKELKQEVHHGSLSKEARIKSEKDFKEQRLKALICTSSLELGIDIGSIDFVIQYLSPRQVSRLIQRVGRAGHGIGKISRGIVLTDEEDVFESAVITRKALATELEPVKMHELALDVLAQQITGMSLDDYDIPAAGIFETVKKAYPYRKLKKEKFYEIVAFLGKLRLIWLNPIYKEGTLEILDYKIRRSKRGWQYYYENLSTIADVRRIRIVSIVEGEPIGFLDESFAAEHGEPGKTFVCNGRAWRVVQFAEDKMIVEPVDDMESAIPAWEGELIPVPYEIAQEVAEIRGLIKNGKEPGKKYPVDKNSEEAMRALVKEQSKRHEVPDDKTFLLEDYKDFRILHCACGTLANNAIGRYIASLITEETGIAVNIKTDPYRIIFQTLAKPESIKKIAAEAKNINAVLEKSIEGSSVFNYRFLQVAKRFGIISRSARFDKVGISRIIQQYAGTPVHEETIREIFLDKMDIEKSEEIFKSIANGVIEIKIQPGLSRLGENGLGRQFSEVLKPRRPEGEIFEAFRRRIMHTYVRLACTSCADYTVTKEVKDMEETSSCPKCSSGMLAVCSKHKKPLAVLKKAKARKALTKDEQKELDTLKRSASLMITYGKQYAITQAGHGIGPDTAARILSQIPKDDEHFFRLIYEAEKTFARTKIYWK